MLKIMRVEFSLIGVVEMKFVVWMDWWGSCTPIGFSAKRGTYVSTGCNVPFGESSEGSNLRKVIFKSHHTGNDHAYLPYIGSVWHFQVVDFPVSSHHSQFLNRCQLLRDGVWICLAFGLTGGTKFICIISGGANRLATIASITREAPKSDNWDIC